MERCSGHEPAVDVAHQRRLAAGAAHRELVACRGAASAVGVVDRQVGEVEAVGRGEQLVDELGRRLHRGPARGAAVVAAGPAALVLHRLEPDLGRLDAQRGVVGDHHRLGVLGLAEGGGEDAVVGLGGIEALGRDLVEHEAVGLDAQRAAPGQRHRVADVAAVGDAQLLEGADDLACGPAHVVDPGLVLVELLHHDQRDHGVGVAEGEQRLRVRDQHRGVEHHPQQRRRRLALREPLVVLTIGGGRGKRSKQVGHGTPTS